MDILTYAKEIETRGHDLYADLATKIPVREVSGIFGFLAEQELRHFEVLDSWQNDARGPAVDNADFPKKARDAFEDLAAQFRTGGVPAINYYDAYEKALDLEKKSLKLYTDALDLFKDAARQSLLKRIMEQEVTHARFLESLMEFQRHPGEWLENAEWNHRDDF